MKFKVEVDETVWEVRTYIVEAESEDVARENLLKGDGEGMIELTESFPDANEITNIRTIEQIEERSQ